MTPCESTSEISGDPRGATGSRTPGQADHSRRALPAGEFYAQARTAIRLQMIDDELALRGRGAPHEA